MLRALLSLLSLLAAPFLGLAAHAPDASDAPPAAQTPVVAEGLSRVTLDASLLPASTGWFLVPVTLTQNATLYVETFVALAGPEPETAAAVIVPSGVPGNTMAFPLFASLGDAAEAHHAGASLRCCMAWPFLPTGALTSTGSEESQEHAAGETLWFGLAAARWGDGSEATINVTANAPVLVVGAPYTGLSVHSVDLLRAAREAGTNARVGDGQLSVGSAGAASRAWTPTGTGLFAVRGIAIGASSAVVDVSLPDGALLADHVMQREFVAMASFTSGGASSVGARDLREPLTRPAVGGEPSILEMHALYADIDVPLEGSWSVVSPLDPPSG